MALRADNHEKIEGDPNVTIFLRPIAAPAALGLAGFARTTWMTATWIARWWDDESSPTIFFPFVAFWGGLGQFIAGLFGYAARDTLITVIHVLWGSFWMSVGLLYLLVATGALPPHRIHEHFPELAAWMMALTFFTLLKERLGRGRQSSGFFPIFRMKTEQKRPLLSPAYGEPGVKRGMPGLT
ncbi:hypothetical protein BJX65DRAFT_304506 [Aspergillus insuetus]